MKRTRRNEEHRSTKRRKRSAPDPTPIYSTREIPWEEQLTLPPRFHEERDVWPAVKILEERGIGRKKEYLLEWEVHPRTGEVFEPSWVAFDNVGLELTQDWKAGLESESVLTRNPQASVAGSFALITRGTTSNQFINSRRANNRRIIPDSSAEIGEEEEEDPIVDNSTSPGTPTLTESPGSADSAASSVEILETQQPLYKVQTSVRVNLPPAPEDKGDWETLRESQFSIYQSPRNINPTADQTGRTPITVSTSLTSSTLQSRASPALDRGRGIRRILNYSSPQSIDSLSSHRPQFSTAPIQQSGIEFIHDETSALNSDTQQPKEYTQQQPVADQSGQTREIRPRNSHLISSSQGPVIENDSQPWVFQSQLPRQSQLIGDNSTSLLPAPSALSGRSARKNVSSQTSQHSDSNLDRGIASPLTRLPRLRTNMAARATRQSPRLQAAIPQADAMSPRIAVRTNSYRNRISGNPPEHSSPLAGSAEIATPDVDHSHQIVPDGMMLNSPVDEQSSSSLSMIASTSIVPSAMHIDPPDSSMLATLSQGSIGSDLGLNTLTTPIQDSIEEEIASSAEEASLASKATSSQESLRNERSVPQVDGLVMPTYPILGDDEYVIALPAEGKVQAIYAQTIKVKRKAILRFIRRRGSVNHASTSTTKTLERNEMIELIGRLHDTTTHIDLGLPGVPTQYSILSQEHARYAEYAGSKFVLLGFLMDYFQRRPATIVIIARSGGTQDLLEEYLRIRSIRVNRHERSAKHQEPEDIAQTGPSIDLISTRANEVIRIDGQPDIIIAFDASFEALHPQVKSLRSQSTKPVPIIHLLVTNSSEHVECCLPPSMPSPIRLRLLVRATYQAHLNLGGSPTIITNPSDELEGRQMDLGDINRAVRKSPNRKLQNVAAVVANATLSDDFHANWTLSSMPDLALDELSESPSTGSTMSATPGRSRNRSQTPMSRGTTPQARKRQLEVDNTAAVSKRQRLTPLNEQLGGSDSDIGLAREQELHRIMESLRVELANEKRARQIAEEGKAAAESKVVELHASIASLQRRYEKRTAKSHALGKANKSLSAATENSKQRLEKVNNDNLNLRQQLKQHKAEVEAERALFKSAAGGESSILEVAREEARLATNKSQSLEKSLDNTKRDFEFLRSQYQTASNRAAELGSQVSELESQVVTLTAKASQEKRLLRELNNKEANEQHLAKIAQLEAEKRSLQVMYKRLEEESKTMKRTRGVQTRGSSMQPSSPGGNLHHPHLQGAQGQHQQQRSRQGSPAQGGGGGGVGGAGGLGLPPTGSRASVLRHER